MSLFADLGQAVPSETVCRDYVHQLDETETSRIQQIIQGKKVTKSKFDNNKFLNILVGNIETPENTYLVDCSIIETANQATVSTKIDDCLRSFRFHERILLCFFRMLPFT